MYHAVVGCSLLYVWTGYSLTTFTWPALNTSQQVVSQVSGHTDSVPNKFHHCLQYRKYHRWGGQDISEMWLISEYQSSYFIESWVRAKGWSEYEMSIEATACQFQWPPAVKLIDCVIKRQKCLIIAWRLQGNFFFLSTLSVQEGFFLIVNLHLKF